MMESRHKVFVAGELKQITIPKENLNIICCLLLKEVLKATEKRGVDNNKNNSFEGSPNV